MSIQAVAWVLDQEFPTNAARAKLVLIAIANHADHTNGYCWLRADTIAREAACGQRSVFRFIGALIRNGYIRKEQCHGPDGKRRANNYWMVLDRAPAEWQWGGGVDAEPGDDPDGAEDSPESSHDDTTTSSIVSSLPHATMAHGDHLVENSEVIHTEHVLAHGPCANGGTWKSLDEPSESKPEGARAKSPPVDRIASGPPRTYRPPPALASPAQGAAPPDRQAKRIFVFSDTPAWDAWVKYKFATTGVTWTLTTRAEIAGRWRTGWYFPSLFPPAAKPPATADPAAIRRDDDEFMRENGLG